MQFPEVYPQSCLIVEMKSKTIPGKFLQKLVGVCDKELNRHAGNKQVRGGTGTECENEGERG